MNQRIRDIDEILGGIHEAVGGDRDRLIAMQPKIDDLLRERAAAEQSTWHGFECYCRACCE